MARLLPDPHRLTEPGLYELPRLTTLPVDMVNTMSSARWCAEVWCVSGAEVNAVASRTIVGDGGGSGGVGRGCGGGDRLHPDAPRRGDRGILENWDQPPFVVSCC